MVLLKVEDTSETSQAFDSIHSGLKLQAAAVCFMGHSLGRRKMDGWKDNQPLCSACPSLSLTDKCSLERSHLAFPHEYLLGCNELCVLLNMLSFQYQDKEEVVLWMNTVGPYHNRQETYKYFSLPFCGGSKKSIDHYHETLGEALQGVELEFSGLDIKFKGKKTQSILLLAVLSEIVHYLPALKCLNKTDLSLFSGTCKKTRSGL